MKTKFQCQLTPASSTLSEAAKTKMLLLCHDVATMLRLDSAWTAGGATDFAASDHVDWRVARRFNLGV